MAHLPTGTVTFLFTDIEGSTQVIQDVGDARYAEALADHRRVLLEAFRARQGYAIETQGDAFLVAFHGARDAILAAAAGQRALTAHAWPDGAALRVRMGLHTGEPVPAGHGYVGLDVHRAARICAAGYGGQILISETTRHLAGDDFPQDIRFQDLGEHRLKDLALAHRLYQVIVADLPRDFPPLRSLNFIPNNLPVQLTTFIGREREIGELVRMLSTSRLVTLTGPGGGGKTRLALQLAADVLVAHPDGVWLVELATLTDPAFVPQTVATALSVRQQPGRPPTATLAEYLRPKKPLLVLDNCEHVVRACAFLAEELLRTCPGLRILATSREALRIPGEVIYAVPSLSLPGGHPSVDDLKRSEAGRLFIERATLAQPAFILQDGEAEALAQICRRLDGNPLAIELAAARVKVLSIRQIAARLDDLFHLLTDGGRTTLPRHQTLLATIDWSHDPLTEQEKKLFRRLSAFAGGWTLAAAEEVCAGDGIEPRDIVDLLTRLVEKSLVVAESQILETRYRMLETIRAYSRGKLAQSEEAPHVQQRLVAWFLSLAERAKPELQGAHQAEWMNQLNADHDNLRVALRASLEAPAVEDGLRLAGALAGFWYRRGYFSEGRMWLEAALARDESAPAGLRAEALHWAGRLATGLSDYEAAQAFDEESLRIFRERGDNRGMAESLHALARVAEVRGDYAAARALYEESLAIFRAPGDRRGMVVVLIDLGRVAHLQGEIALGQRLLEQSLAISTELGERSIKGATLHALGMSGKDRADYAAARTLLEESVTIFQQLGNDRYAAWSFSGLGAIARRQGKYDEARRLYEDSLQVFNEVGDRHRAAESLQGLGDVMLDLGDLAASSRHYEQSLSLYRKLEHKWGSAEALAGLGWVALRGADHTAAPSLFEESLRLSQEVGHKRSAGFASCGLGKLALLAAEYGRAARFYRDVLVLLDGLEEKRAVAECLEGLAAVAVGRRQIDRSANLLGAAAALRQAIGAPLAAADRVDRDKSVSALREVAGEAPFERAWSEGAALTLRQALACALNEHETTTAPRGEAFTAS